MKVSAEQKKEMIIQNFVSLIQQFGINRLTLNDVAEKSGLTKSALYYYFDSKETLMIATFNHFHDKMLAKFQAIAKNAETPKEVLLTYCRFYLSLTDDDEFYGLMKYSEEVTNELAKYVVNTPEIAKAVLSSREQDLEGICQILADYAGVKSNDPRFVYILMIFQGFISGFTFSLLRENKDSSLLDALGINSRFSWKSLKEIPKEDICDFIITGLDTLIKKNFKDKK